MKTIEINNPEGISVKINITNVEHINDYVDAIKQLLVGITFQEKTVDMALGLLEEDEGGRKRKVFKIGKYEVWKYE